MRRVIRILRNAVLALLVALALFYVGFVILLEVTAREWLGRAPFHEAVDVRSREPHRVALLDEGRDALALRLQLIRDARESIDLEIFIYELDSVSRLISQALAERARAGVRVRLLVDFASPVFKLRPVYAQALREAGVEVRYYNTAALARFFTVQHRTHRKLLAIDGRIAIVGGRNVANDYFDLSERYNFLDSDLLIEGPVVPAMVRSFELYWGSDWAAVPTDLTGEDAGVDEVRLLSPRTEELALAQGLLAQPARPEPTTCNDLQFVTDYPGAGVGHRKVYAALVALSAEAEREILIETPYFVLRGDGTEAMRSVLKRGVRMTVLTNSLRSTDAYYTVAALLPALDELRLPGFALWAYRGDPPPANAGREGGAQRWGVHAKRAVLDDDTIVIGTYNIDPRSANLNSELIVICRGNTELAGAMRRGMAARLEGSAAIVGTEDAGGRTALVAGAPTWEVVKMALATPLVRLFGFLL